MSEYLAKEYSKAALNLREALLTLSPAVDSMLETDFSTFELSDKNVQMLDFIKSQTTNLTLLQVMLVLVTSSKED